MDTFALVQRLHLESLEYARMFLAHWSFKVLCVCLCQDLVGYQ